MLDCSMLGRKEQNRKALLGLVCCLVSLTTTDDLSSPHNVCFLRGNAVGECVWELCQRFNRTFSLRSE